VTHPELPPFRASPAPLPCVCTAVRRADRVLSRLYDDALRPSGLTATQYALLSRLAASPPSVPHGSLAGALAMAGTTLSHNLAPLARDGLVRVEPGGDRRTRDVVITAEGWAALDRARPLLRSAQDRVIAAGGRDRIEALLGELSELVARFH
jgi:DNA-binding MarR family transcriptional regulator